MTTEQLLADKGQVWFASDPRRELPHKVGVLCSIIKSFPKEVVVNFMSDNSDILLRVPRELLIRQLKVGEGVTHISSSDRYPYTVVDISKSGKRVNVQADKYERTDSNGLSTSQDYMYERNPKAPIITLLRRKDGSWWNKDKGLFVIGTRQAYIDPDF